MKTRFKRQLVLDRGTDGILAMLNDLPPLVRECSASVKIRTLREILKLWSYLSIAYLEQLLLLHRKPNPSHPSLARDERLLSALSWEARWGYQRMREQVYIH